MGLSGTRTDPFVNGNNLSESISLKETNGVESGVFTTGVWGGRGLTYTVASASLQNTPSSLFGVVGKLAFFQKFGVSTQS